MEFNDNEHGSDVTPTPPPRFQCTMCPKSFTLRESLVRHRLSKHVENKLKSFHCDECFKINQQPKYFANRVSLTQHMKRLHGPARFKCEVCFKTFGLMFDFTVHKRIHSPNIVKSVKCDLCSKSFFNSTQLRSHLFHKHKQKCKDVSYFNCEFCSHEFEFKSQLERHVIDKHVVGKSFTCAVCYKTFIDEATLEKHTVRIHVKSERFVCDVCSTGFTMKSNLIKHLEVEHNQLFYCDNCLRSFKNKPEFTQHLDSKISSEHKFEFKCQICFKILKSQCNFDIHTNCHLKEIKTGKLTTEPKLVPKPELKINEELLDLECKRDPFPRTYGRPQKHRS